MGVSQENFQCGCGVGRQNIDHYVYHKVPIRTYSVRSIPRYFPVKITVEVFNIICYSGSIHVALGQVGRFCTCICWWHGCATLYRLGPAQMYLSTSTNACVP